MELALVILYSFFLLFIFGYSLVQLHLVFLFRSFKRKKKAFTSHTEVFIPTDSSPYTPAECAVTVQLPIYNEKYVIERLIDAVAQFDYPKELLEIQVLDDSTDETTLLLAQKKLEWQAKGINIQHIRRKSREGFKAGALAYGLELAQGQFIAIFDADFLPEKDFLKRTLPEFADEKVGVVQTRWLHLNENYSLLTQLQAFTLNAHFHIEQTGRNFGNHFINFNGTGGVWRKSCIIDAGGWEADTLTEDLDLSYRAQLKGWKFRYLPEVGTPSELPVAIQAMKTQQFRWTKGAAECTRKNLWKVWKAKNLPFSTKIHALFHLMNSFIFPSVVFIAVMSLPILWIKVHYPVYKLLFQVGSLFLISLFFLMFYYWTSYREDTPQSPFRFLYFLGRFFLFLAVSMGFSLHNAIAVMEGYLGKKTPFVRTPKFNIYDRKDTWKHNQYLLKSLNLITLVEGFLALYFLGGIALGIYLDDYGLLPFHFLLSLGFGYIFIYSIRQSMSSNISS
ncbi:MAG: glycosyltransferase [Microscillaceae bacterium]|nr:glycosyltransferase [Microscillaceae bacterium]